MLTIKVPLKSAHPDISIGRESLGLEILTTSDEEESIRRSPEMERREKLEFEATAKVDDDNTLKLPEITSSELVGMESKVSEEIEAEEFKTVEVWGERVS